MFRRVQGRNINRFIKRVSRTFARRTLGLEVSKARSRKYNLHPYERNYKLVTRFMHFQNLLHEIKPVDGNIVECGVGPGSSLFDFAVISAVLDRPRHIYGFDTFEGLPAPASEDGAWNTRMEGAWSYSQEHVREELLLAGLDEDFISTSITLIPGEFSQALPGVMHNWVSPIALLHIDVDIYESYKVVLENFYSHVVTGGIIAFDEYSLSSWPGATRAIDEFFADKPEKIVKSPVAERYYTVKV